MVVFEDRRYGVLVDRSDGCGEVAFSIGAARRHGFQGGREDSGPDCASRNAAYREDVLSERRAAVDDASQRHRSEEGGADSSAFRRHQNDGIVSVETIPVRPLRDPPVKGGLYIGRFVVRSLFGGANRMIVVEIQPAKDNRAENHKCGQRQAQKAATQDQHRRDRDEDREEQEQ